MTGGETHNFNLLVRPLTACDPSFFYSRRASGCMQALILRCCQARESQLLRRCATTFSCEIFAHLQMQNLMACNTCYTVSLFCISHLLFSCFHGRCSFLTSFLHKNNSTYPFYRICAACQPHRIFYPSIKIQSTVFHPAFFLSF